VKRKFSDDHLKNLSKAQSKRWKNKKLRKKQSLILRESRSLETEKERKKYSPKNPNVLTIKQIKERYPFFYKIEKIRFNKNTKQIEVKCKYCNKWFTPKSSQLRSRICAVEHEDGNDGCFLYCSKKCKQLCPSFGVKKETSIKQEYFVFREFVLERDNYTCQFCGKRAKFVHHERPKKIEPFFEFDPDLAWSCCKKCHYKKGHPSGTECSHGYLAHKNC
jgi:hypothetical protein